MTKNNLSRASWKFSALQSEMNVDQLQSALGEIPEHKKKWGESRLFLQNGHMTEEERK
jgi:hypothetical protein